MSSCPTRKRAIACRYVLVCKRILFMRGSQRDPRLSKIRLKSADWTRGSEELHVEHVEGINTPLSQEQSGRLSETVWTKKVLTEQK